MANLVKIYQYLEEHKWEHVAKIQEFLRQPSISTENRGIRECAQLLMEYYRKIGCQEVELVETGVHPCIWAYYHADAPKTLINYCMYDVQPVLERPGPIRPLKLSWWRSPPLNWWLWLEGLITVKGDTGCGSMP